MLYCLVREAHRCEQLVQGCYAALSQRELNIQLLIASTTPYEYITLITRRVHYYEHFSTQQKRYSLICHRGAMILLVISAKQYSLQ